MFLLRFVIMLEQAPGKSIIVEGAADTLEGDCGLKKRGHSIIYG
jgi:hypothetical protein